MKVCIRCNTEKPLSNYYKHIKMADGHLNKCKECSKRENTKNRDKKIEYYREYDKKRANNPERVAARESFAKSEAGIISQSKAKARYIEKNPIKRAAHNMVSNALKSGLLKRSLCEVCGTSKNIHAHHDDYALPLVVKWLCAPHHAEWHKNNTALFGGVPI
jgi:hypothetical protein